MVNADTNLGPIKGTGMPAYTEVNYGAPCWVDLTSTILEDVKPFYSALFNWTFQDIGPEFGHYNLISVGNDIAGGAMQFSPEFMGPVPIDAWSLYFATEDVEATISRAVELGGKGFNQAHQVGEQGTMGELVDPSGAIVGLWRPEQRKGFDRYGEPGFPGWFELTTRDFDDVSSFYASLFNAEVGNSIDSDGIHYQEMHVGGRPSFGIWDVSDTEPEDQPARWNVYFVIEDTDAAVATAKKNGGSVVMEP